jgi:hypothetical protein
MDWTDDFPMTETYPSALGRDVEFYITAKDLTTGFLIEATETEKSRGKRFGFTLSCFSRVDPYEALGNLRRKIRKRLATRYLATHEAASAWLSHDELVGIIDYDIDSDEIIIQVDGEALTMDQLATILKGHEGFEVRLQIVEQL